MICPKCGKEVGTAVPFCEFCGATLPKQPEEDCAFEGEHEHLQELEEAPKPLLGFLGALGGAILGGAVMVLISRLGFVSAYGGLALTFLIFMGYRLLSKKMSKIGFGVCIMFALVTPYFADRVDWALWLMEELKELTFTEAFFGVQIMLDAGYIDVGTYYSSLLQVYLFTAAGAVAYISSIFKARRNAK